MTFESLANELLLDIFEFLTNIQLLCAFHDLNQRFDNLLVTHFQSSPLAFRSTLKTDFDTICRQKVPVIADSIVSLRLSDGDQTAQQTACLLSRNLNLGRFNNLQSLSLSDIRSYQIMGSIMEELCFLSRLIDLNIIDCYFRSEYIDNIWRLPTLTDLNLNSSYYSGDAVTPTVESLSLENVSFRGTTYQSTFLERLLEYTPRLRHLSIGLVGGDVIRQLRFRIPPIEILEWSTRNSIIGLQNLVQSMRNLVQLTVQTNGSYVSGDWWENIITVYLPNLKIFRLVMQFSYGARTDKKEHVDLILESFRTDFWIKERHWFVRCHHHKNGLKRLSYCCLYTLPYAFSDFFPRTHADFKSTCVHDDACYSYDRVHSFSYNFDFSNDFLQLRFSNLQHLTLSRPIKDHFWRVIPSLKQLRSLSVRISGIAGTETRLQALVEKAPRLYSLECHSTHSVSPVALLQLRSTSIRQLDSRSINSFFDGNVCRELVQSPLGTLCEILLIKVQKQANILFLANNMKNLRILNVQCQNVPTEREDIFIKCLKKNSPATCTITRTAYRHYILWIR